MLAIAWQAIFSFEFSKQLSAINEELVLQNKMQ